MIEFLIGLSAVLLVALALYTTGIITIRIGDKEWCFDPMCVFIGALVWISLGGAVVFVSLIYFLGGLLGGYICDNI